MVKRSILVASVATTLAAGLTAAILFPTTVPSVPETAAEVSATADTISSGQKNGGASYRSQEKVSSYKGGAGHAACALFFHTGTDRKFNFRGKVL
jgi:hypothetical protein